MAAASPWKMLKFSLPAALALGLVLRLAGAPAAAAEDRAAAGLAAEARRELYQAQALLAPAEYRAQLAEALRKYRLARALDKDHREARAGIERLERFLALGEPGRTDPGKRLMESPPPEKDTTRETPPPAAEPAPAPTVHPLGQDGDPPDRQARWDDLTRRMSESTPETRPALFREILTQGRRELAAEGPPEGFSFDMFSYLLVEFLRLAPDPAGRREMAAFIDDLHAARLRQTPDSPDLWRIWGRTLYDCAFLAFDGAERQDYIEKAGEKYGRAPGDNPNRALLHQAMDLALLLPRPALDENWPRPAGPDPRAAERQALELAVGLMRRVEEVRNPAALKTLLRGNLLRLAVLQEGDDQFQELFREAEALNEKDPGTDRERLQANFTWGRALARQHWRAEGEPPLSEVRLLVLGEALVKAYRPALRLTGDRRADQSRLVALANDCRRLAALGPRDRDRSRELTELAREAASALADLNPKRPEFHLALGLAGLESLAAPYRNPEAGLEVPLNAILRRRLVKPLAACWQGLELLSEAEVEPRFGPEDYRPPWEETAGENLLPGDGPPRGRPGPDPETYGELAAGSFFFHFRRLEEAVAPLGPGAWPLAELYRRAATAGWLPADEALLYWRRAAEILFFAAREIRPRAEGETPTAANQARELALVLSEQALTLAEMTLLEAVDHPHELLARASELWEEAERLAPDSSRYARARWAARRGEEARVREYLPHSPFQERRGLYPVWAWGRGDPAFADFRDQAWFKRAWFGYGF